MENAISGLMEANKLLTTRSQFLYRRNLVNVYISVLCVWAHNKHQETIWRRFTIIDFFLIKKHA